MDLETTNLVRPQDERPGRPDGTCFYCRAAMGQPHKSGCVILGKSVVMRITLDVVMDVPRDWKPGLIDFHFNDSSWCADNFVGKLEAWKARTENDDDERCLCSTLQADFVRDATPEDHASLPVLIDPGER